MNPNNRRPENFNYRRLSPEDEYLIPRPSVLLPHLQENEKKFFVLVHSGDVNAVREFLLENDNFNINCKNFQGVSALLVALQTKSEPMIEFLLTQNINIGDCVLHAIRDNQLKILEMLLEKQFSISPSTEFSGVIHSSDFPDYVTPLILAAQCGHYEIIELLIERGHTISKPHSPRCRCKECISKLEKDDLLHAENLRINLYRSVCSPAYICHSSRDPILTSFQLSNELQECSRLVPEFRQAYQTLARDVSDFAVDLINCCRNAEEMELILSESNGNVSKICIFPRLILALDYKQKTFVAHPNTQNVLERAWLGNWFDYNMKSTFAQVIYPFYRVFVLPVILIMSLVVPKHALIMYWSLPINRMLNHCATFIIFLILIFIESNLKKTDQKREPPDSGLEPIIILFVFGNIWNIIRMCLIQGPKRYFRYLWNWHAVISNIMFCLAFVFWLASILDGINNGQTDLERKYWYNLDPILVAEGFFAVATIMTYFRLLFFCRLNYYLGPLQISLGKMCADLAKYITVFLIITLSFTIGLCRFYHYYEGMVQTDPVTGSKTTQVASFVNFRSTLKTFFWEILGMSPIESADVIIENLPGEKEGTTIINKHYFTETIGYIAFAFFQLLSSTMLLNMLVATMSSTFQRVLDNLDVEWIFGKTDFYVTYMLQSTLPSPFNLIPTPLGVTTFMEMFQSKKAENLDKIESDLDDIDIIDEQKLYPALITQLVQRYFRDKDSTITTENNFETLKQEINEMKQTIADLNIRLQQN